MRTYLAILCAFTLLSCGQRAPAASTSTGAGSSDAGGGSTTTTGGTSGASTSSGGSSGTTGALADLDQDGLDDGFENQVASAYLPYLSLAPNDGCAKPDGLVVRVSPHPDDPTRPPRFLEIRYDHLYQSDCGLDGHLGDDENIALTVDTTLPAPAGIMVIKAISHRNTACEHTSECVQQRWTESPCSGYARCDTGPPGATRSGFPVIYASKNKHGDYTTTNGCTFGCDVGACTLASEPALPPLKNVGEPGHPLVSDLSAQGFITADAGWTEAALHDYDPWGPDAFGAAGVVSADLTDAALDTPICR